MDACSVAANIVQMAADAGDRIDHLKLQKLCYYAQGYSQFLTASSVLLTSSTSSWFSLRAIQNCLNSQDSSRVWRESTSCTVGSCC